MKIRSLFFIGVITLLSFSACEKDKDDPIGEVTIPEIISLTANKTVVQFGGHDPILITCVATGGDLDYTWSVDLGDLIPMNEDGSVYQFTASDCCIGDKIITCTVENSLDSKTDTVSIYINPPE